jgi:hypothetical protein
MNYKAKKVVFQAVVILFVAAMVVSGSVSARGAYKWVDEDGVVHYSDRMRGTEASIINIKVKEEKESETNQGESADEDKPDPATDADQEEANVKAAKEQKRIRKANCIKAREQLAANESMSRMYRAGKNGEREYLTDKERGDVMKRSVDSVKYWCD